MTPRRRKSRRARRAREREARRGFVIDFARDATECDGCRGEVPCVVAAAGGYCPARDGAEEDGDFDDPELALCHYCGGDGAGIVGTDWDSDDPINGPYDGDIETCPCCGGTGRAEDCVFW